MARKVVLAGACRTAIGVMGGQFANTSAVELGTIVIKEALKRAGVSPDQVDEVYMGNVIQAGNGQNPARQAAVYAGIPTLLHSWHFLLPFVWVLFRTIYLMIPL